MSAPTDHQIDDAIRYAMRHAPITEVQHDEGGDFQIEIYEEESTKEFVLAVLRDLRIIK